MGTLSDILIQICHEVMVETKLANRALADEEAYSDEDGDEQK